MEGRKSGEEKENLHKMEPDVVFKAERVEQCLG